MRRARAVLAAVVAIVALGAAVASGERSQVGNVIASLGGGISPSRLPRHRPAPVGIHLGGRLRTADGSTLPRVIGLELALAGGGRVFTRGLPVCTARRLRDTHTGQALAACGPALVGHGRVEADVLIPHQPPLRVRARLLVFNGRAPGGRAALLLHGYSANPPTSVVIPFLLLHRHGRFSTALVATLPRSLGPWPRLASFEMTISRRFVYRGAEHSLLSATCPAPPRFTVGFFNLARVTYTLAGGGRVSTEMVRSCSVR